MYNKRVGQKAESKSSRKPITWLGFEAKIIGKSPFFRHENPTKPHALQGCSSSQSDRKMKFSNACLIFYNKNIAKCKK